MTAYAIPKQHLFILFIAAFLIRAFTFCSFTSQNEYYKQADSNDYHIGALCLSYGFGMCRPDTGEPQFWRTPGYSAYLVPFYKLFPPTGFQFSDAAMAQKASIWFQIFLSSFIPIILLYLALLLTQNSIVGYVTAVITIFHLGLVLTSGYLLTEGISLLPFYLFLYFFYRNMAKENNRLSIFAALMLGLYTWIRPMGSYIAVVACIIMFIFLQGNWKHRCKKIALFMGCFLLLLSPWYIRNYYHTGYWFFCPMFGAYLNSFCAPRIVSSVENIELIDAWKKLSSQAHIAHMQQKQIYFMQHRLHLPKEFVCGQIAWPIFLSHPLLAGYDWMREVFKTTFDLYASQLVAFVQGCFFYDPLIEYLSTKLADCLYATPMPLAMRIIVYLELIYTILLWMGLLYGLVIYMIRPLFTSSGKSDVKQYKLWWSSAIMCAATVFMTGGFGYARLRLPVEPLMIIFSCVAWQQILFLFGGKTHSISKNISRKKISVGV